MCKVWMMTSSCNKCVKIIGDDKINGIFGSIGEFNQQSTIYFEIVLVNCKVKINKFIKSFLLLELIHSNALLITYHNIVKLMFN